MTLENRHVLILLTDGVLSLCITALLRWLGSSHRGKKYFWTNLAVIFTQVLSASLAVGIFSGATEPWLWPLFLLTLPSAVLGAFTLSKRGRIYNIFSWLSINPAIWALTLVLSRRRTVDITPQFLDLPNVGRNGGKQWFPERCEICGCLNMRQDSYCKYCGYRTRSEIEDEDHRYYLYVKTGNSSSKVPTLGLTRIFISRVPNFLEKRHVIFDKIKVEQQRRKEIELVLQNIRDQAILGKVLNIVTKVDAVLQRLFLVRFDLEFQRFQSSLLCIEEFAARNRELSAASLNDWIGVIVSEFNDWVKKAQALRHSDAPKENLEAKQSVLDHLVERISMAKIGNLVSSATTVIGLPEVEDHISNEKYESALNDIEYEIDRLNSEVEVEN